MSGVFPFASLRFNSIPFVINKSTTLIVPKSIIRIEFGNWPIFVEALPLSADPCNADRPSRVFALISAPDEMRRAAISALSN